MNLIDEVNSITESILDEWEKDSQLDRTELSQSTVDNRRLHTKYARKQYECNRELAKFRDIISKARAIKRKMVLDGPSKEDWHELPEKTKTFIDNLPKAKQRLSSPEQKDFMEGDEDIRLLTRLIECLEARAVVLKEIIYQINNATFQIKNILDDIKIKNGIV